jgi:hypothetical protein
MASLDLSHAAGVKHDHRNPRPLPDAMPLNPNLTGVDMAFSTAAGYLHKGGAYLDYYEGQCEQVPREWQDKANTLFFSGGSLADLGLQVKPDLDPAVVRANIRWLLSSWGPKHEEKQATVGFALMSWCEPYVPQDKADTPHQTQRKKARKGKGRIARATGAV